MLHLAVHESTYLGSSMREQGSSDDVIRPLIGGAPPPDRLVAWGECGSKSRGDDFSAREIRGRSSAQIRGSATFATTWTLSRAWYPFFFLPTVRIGSRRYVIVRDAGVYGEPVSLACKVARNGAVERNDREDELKYCGISYMKVY